MGLFSTLFGGGKQTSKNEPWKEQAPYLKDAFGKAQGLYNQTANTPFYQGDLYADMDPAQRDALLRMLGYTKGSGQDNADALTATGFNLLNGGGLEEAIGNYSKAASADPTQANIAAAGAYANNPYMDGMVDAASRDINRGLYETELPGINRAATGTGNINSSRAGVAEGIARRGAADRIGDISASLRGGAYQAGLGLAEGARTANLSAMGNVAGMRGNQMGMGLNTLSMGRDWTMGNYGAQVDAGKMFQDDRQGQMDADFARWKGNDDRGWDMLNRYYGIIGSNNWGGTQTNSGGGANLVGKGLGIASVVAGLSDRRLKKNITKVGELEDGLPVYEYDYIWGERSTGVMADEVAEIRPWALGPKVGDFQTVNYAAL